LAASARHSECGVLGFLDLDAFKKVNDIYGHMAGDAVLRFVAKKLKAHVRPTDIVSRVSGDEFAVILTRCSSEQGKGRIIKLRDSINGSIVHYAGHEIEVSCSIGYSAFDGKSDPAVLIENADKSMYCDKQSRSSISKTA
jgi:diguanylate cyclase (GGDEF)-like protein